MKQFLITCTFIFVSILFCSCATLFNSTTQEVEIRTTPPYAKLLIDEKKYGTTPQNVNVERKNNHVVKIELDGFDTYETQITGKLSTYFWGNIFNGILPGVIVDMTTGGMYELLPERLNIQLQETKKPDLSTQKK